MYAGKIVAKSIEEAFHLILDDLKEFGTISSPRNHRICELQNVNVIVENPRARIIACPERKFSAAYAFGELAWYLSGRNDVETMGYYSKFIKNCSDDGETLNSAYGYRIFTGNHPKIGFDQWENCIRLLRNDKDSRQAVIHLHTPNNQKTKDEVCTMSLQFLIREDKLNMIVTMRSNDVVLGFTYDAFAFTMLQEIMAKELGVELGYYCHNVGSMHIYLDDYYGKGKFNLLECGHTRMDVKPMEPIKSEFLAYDFVDLVSAEKHYRCGDNLNVEEEIKKVMASGEDELMLFYKAAFLMKYLGARKDMASQTKLLQMIHDAGHNMVSDILSYDGCFGKNNMKIIVDGPDRIGKTTLINFLAGFNCPDKANVLHYGIPSEEFNFDSNYRIHFESSVNQIFDRNFISEMVYSAVLGRECRIKDVDGLIKSLIDNNVLVIIMVAANDSQMALLHERANASEEDKKLDMFIAELNAGYVDIARVLKERNVMVKLFDMNMKEIPLEV